MRPDEVTYDRLREVGTDIRVHGNGFIQLDVEEGQRVHVWGSPSIPHQRVSSQIHSHRFDFESAVIVGRMENRRIQIVAGLGYRLYYPSAIGGEATKLVRGFDHETCHPVFDAPEILFPGESYRMDHREFHASITHMLTMTLMTKTANFPAFAPAVLLPVGAEPDNYFDRYRTPDDMLWEIVRQACNEIPRKAS